MNRSDLIADIPYETAQAAHSGTSFVPGDRARQEQNGYADTLMGDYDRLAASCPQDRLPQLEEEFGRYREGYRRRYLALLHSESRIMSWMITGPANFPVRQMEKRNAVAHRRRGELIDFRSRALNAIRKTLHPESRPIMSGDSDAQARLKAEIADAETRQQLMRETNAAIRKHWKAGPDAVVAALLALGHSEPLARQLIAPDPCHGQGYPDYKLRNNNANIKRMRGRLIVIERNQSTPDSATDGSNARIEDCPSENRVRLYFPGKPDADVRGKLKSCGFRWTPSLGCWQAYRNYRTQETAKEVAGIA